MIENKSSFIKGIFTSSAGISGLIIGFVVGVAIIIFGMFQLFSGKQENQPNIVKKDTVSSWDPKTASFIEYASYEEMEQEWENERKIEVEEYDKTTKGTIVEQIQNINIPSDVDESDVAQLQQGEIEVRGEKSEDFPDGVFLWGAYLVENIQSFTIGDFNNDGLDDVAHIIAYTGGGSGMFYNLAIFMNNQGKLKYLTQEELGDRVIIRSVKYDSGEFIVDIITQGEGDNFKGLCCPNVPKTVKFKLENNKLVEI